LSPQAFPCILLPVEKFIPIFAVILLSMSAGYLARRFRIAGDRAANRLMTVITVLGYPSVSLLTIWDMTLQLKHIWLPLMAVVQVAMMAALASPIAARLTKDRGERGAFVLLSAYGNNGLTMGGFVVFMLFGAELLGPASLFFLLFPTIVVLLGYPIARHYSSQGAAQSLGRLLVKSLLDWRSLALPISLTGVGLSLGGVPVPEAVKTIHVGLGWVASIAPGLSVPEVQAVRVIDMLVYGINISAYFSIGLRLQVSHVAKLRVMIVGLMCTRFVLGLATGFLLIGLTWLTPWPIQGAILPVAIIQSCVSTAVTAVALTNMFNLRPAEASALFITNTLLYLLLVLPPFLWMYR